MCDPLGPFIGRLAEAVDGEWAECLRDLSPADRLEEIEEQIRDSYHAAEVTGDPEEIATAERLTAIVKDLRVAKL
jgi:hypothetical protein